MHRYLKIYKIFITQYLKSILEYKADFLVGMMGYLIQEATGLFFILLVIAKVPSLNGWSFKQIVFIYGLAQIPRAIDHLLFDNLWLLNNKVRRGEMDRYLLRPINPLFQFLSERFSHEAFGELFAGIIIIIYAINVNMIDMSIVNILLLLYIIFCGVIIYFSLKLLTASTSFWIINSFQVTDVVYSFSEFSKYPLAIFPKWLKIILTWIIPFGVVSAIPSRYIFHDQTISFTLGIITFISVLFFTLAYTTWHYGLKSYQSAGN